MTDDNECEDLNSTLTWALRRALDWLDYANRGESLVEVEKGIAEVHEILRINGLHWNSDGHLVPISEDE